MRIGAILPQTEIGASPANLQAWASAVEELGYQHISAFDHVLGAGTARRPGWVGYTSADSFHEVFVLFGYLAALTDTVELCTGVLVLPQRQTALVAKQAAEVDVLSGGRLRLGVGIGWNTVEYQALGVPFERRGVRLEEQVDLLRMLWAADTASFSGRWHEVDDAGVRPRPASGRIPVWFGGHAPAVLRRVGRTGDGWLPYVAPDESAKENVRTVAAHAVAAGRDPADIGIEPRLTLASVPEPERLSYATRWRDLGATHLSVHTAGLGLSTVDEQVAALRDTMALLRPLTDERS